MILTIAAIHLLVSNLCFSFDKLRAIWW